MIIFSLNMVLGFACSVGIDMGYNQSHHHSETTNSTHPHSSVHQTAPNDHHTSHTASTNAHSSKSGTEDCCKNQVHQFAKLDKLSLQLPDFVVIPGLFVSSISSCYYTHTLNNYISLFENNYFALHHHPPDTDLRIIIQRFQI